MQLTLLVEIARSFPLRMLAPLACSVLAALPLQAAEMRYHHLIEWSGSSADARVVGLQLFRGDESGQVMDILVERADDVRLILTYELDAISGGDRYRLQDEATGFWIEVERKWPRRWNSLNDFLTRGNDDLEDAARRNEEISVVIRSREGTISQLDTPVLPPTEAFVALGSALSSRTARQVLEDQLPEQVESVLPFLEAALSTQSVGSQLGPFIGLLRQQAGIPASAVPAGAWSEQRTLARGLVIDDPEYQRLLDRFVGFDRSAL